MSVDGSRDKVCNYWKNVIMEYKDVSVICQRAASKPLCIYSTMLTLGITDQSIMPESPDPLTLYQSTSIEG